MNFDERAKNWDKNLEVIERAEIFANNIEKIVQPKSDMNAFDFGCGTGLLSYILRDQFNSITLIDTSQGMIDALNQKITESGIINFTPRLFDFLNEDIGEYRNKFDIAYTSMALHHIEDVNQIIQKFNSILKSGTYLCIADLDKEDGSFHSKFPDFTGHFGFEKSEIESSLTQNGFEIINYEIVYEIIRTLENGDTKKYPIFLIVAKKK